MAYPQIASRSVESFAPGHIYAGISDVVTAPAIMVAGTYVYLQVMGRITASGKLKAHDPAASEAVNGVLDVRSRILDRDVRIRLHSAASAVCSVASTDAPGSRFGCSLDSEVIPPRRTGQKGHVRGMG